MKIYLSSGHSCGKTTLARYISQQYKLPFIPETARLVLAEKELQIDILRADISLTDNYQLDVFNRQITEEKKYKDFVSDRSLIDILAYSAQHSRISQKLFEDQLFKDYIDALRHKNSIVFFIRPAKELLKSDGVRESGSFNDVISIDAMIKLLLEIHNIKYYQINTSSAQERIKFVNSVLSLYE
jgi:predicted ATPase